MALPGYYVAVILVNTMSLISLQQAGFILLSCSYLLLSLVSFLGPALPFGTPVKFFLLGVTFFFSNLGPNPTTFILPIEVLPQSARATGHGICSAAGKLGGVVGSVLFGAVSVSRERPSDAGIHTFRWDCALMCSTANHRSAFYGRPSTLRPYRDRGDRAGESECRGHMLTAQTTCTEDWARLAVVGERYWVFCGQYAEHLFLQKRSQLNQQRAPRDPGCDRKLRSGWRRSVSSDYSNSELCVRKFQNRV